MEKRLIIQCDNQVLNINLSNQLTFIVSEEDNPIIGALLPADKIAVLVSDYLKRLGSNKNDIINACN